MRGLLSSFGAAGAVLLGLTGAAMAHPHIFIDAKATLVFDDQGELATIHNSWTFDEAFSVWQIQGLDTNNDGITSSDEMQDLADENLKGLGEYGFYVSAGEGQDSLAFTAVGGAKFEFKDNRSTLTFDIAPETAYRVKGKLQVAIADPEYYVAITFAGPQDATLENAPAGCVASLQPGHDMPDDLAAQLFAIPPDVTKLPPDLEAKLRGVQGSILVDCSAAKAGEVATPATALDAVNDVAQAKVTLPFGGPPAEPGFILPRTGFLGWIAKMQSDFYQAMTASLGKLKSDYNAFWLLGGLSFLYGIFHAAGPGHGKVVIGSYMLANERQVRRGIVLSFAAALMQSVVAVVFIGVAVALLGLSSIAMGTAVGWMETASYGFVALLGLWLIARKVFGWGHGHHHEAPKDVRKKDMQAVARAHLGSDGHALRAAPGSSFQFQPALQPAGVARLDAYGRVPGDAHYGHDHSDAAHEHEHDHKHVVTAEETLGDWREQLGVVIGVGLRPCSGALVVLVFALSQGVLAAGIAAVFLMGLGTAITVASLATLAVSAKGLARRLLGRDSRLGGALIWWAELGGAVVVFAFGVVLLLATWPVH